MKKTILTNLIITLVLTATALQAQSIGDFKTKASGAWKNISIWQTWDGTSWIDADTLPDPLSEYAHISSGDSVVLDTAMVLNKVIIDGGGILTLSNTLLPFSDTLNNSDSNLEINGHLYIADNATILGTGALVNNPGGIVSFISNSSLELPVTNNGSMYLEAYLTVFNSTFTNNGLLVLEDNTILNLTNSTLQNNDSISVPGNAVVTSANSGLFINSSAGVVHKLDRTASLHLDPVITFANWGTLSGMGIFDLPMAVLNTGIIEPGDSAGSLSITPSAVSGRTPVFEMEIDGTGAVAGTSYDQVTFVATFPVTTNLSGSSLLFTDNGNTDPIGTIYTIMTSSSFITGTFASVSIPPGYGIHYNLTTVTLEKLAPLEVTWGSLTATALDKHSYLQWTTLRETDAVYFTIEYSTDGFQYVTLDTIAAKGFSNNSAFYEYLHRNPSNGLNYYRIRLTEENGGEKYSPSVSLRMSDTVLQIAPNPVSDVLHVHISSEKATVRVVNAQGEEVRQVMIVEGFNTMFFGDLTPGVYQLFIQQDNEVPDVSRIVKL